MVDTVSELDCLRNELDAYEAGTREADTGDRVAAAEQDEELADAEFEGKAMLECTW